MRRHIIARVFAGLLLLWFTVISGEPAALHSCPVHDLQAGAHAATATHSVHSHSAPDQDRGHGACTCIGACCASALTSAIPSARVALAPSLTRQLRSPLPPAESSLPTAAAFLLPYANGPPARRVLA